MKICPNKKNAQVMQEFQELVDAVGETAAYDIWNQNGGYSIDKNKNGEDSVLFKQIMDAVKDRNKAIVIKSRIYSKSFKEWYDGKNWSMPVTFDNYNVVFVHPFMTENQTEDFDSNKYINFDKSIEKDLKAFVMNEIDPNNEIEDHLKDTYFKQYTMQYKQHPKYVEFLKQKFEEAKEKAADAKKVLLLTSVSSADIFNNQTELFFDVPTKLFTERAVASGISAELSAQIKEDLNSSLNRVKSADKKITNNSFNEVSTESELNVNGEPQIEYSHGKFVKEGKSEAFNDATDTVFTYDDVMNSISDLNAKQTNLTAVLGDLRAFLANTVQSRVNAINVRKLPNKAQLLQPLEQQLQNLTNPLVSDLENIIYAITDIHRTMGAPVQNILLAQSRLKRGLDPGISNNMLIQFQQDYFGMYNRVTEEIASKLFDSDLYANVLGRDNFEKLKSAIVDIRTNFKAAQQAITDLTSSLAEKTLLEHGHKLNNYTIRNFVNENLNVTQNDMTMVMRWIGAGDKMNDQAIKAVFKMVSDADDKVRFSTYEVGNKLLRLYKKVSVGDQLKLFEYDNDGKKTGYFVREKKYGVFLKDLDQKRSELKTKYNVESERQMPLDAEDRVEFNKELNEWLSKHCERRYTKEYYDLFNSVGEEAKNRRDAIQFKIYELLDQVRDENGKPHLEKLTEKQYKMYKGYKVQLKMLSTKYYESGDLKTDLDKQVSDELSSLSKKLSEGVKREVDMDAYQIAKAKAKKELTKEQYETWKKRYTKVHIDEEFYKMLSKVAKKEYGELYQKLYEQKQDLLKPYRDDHTTQIDTSLMSAQLKRTLDSIDNTMRRIRKSSRKSKKHEQDVVSEDAIDFEEIAEIKYTESYYRDQKEAMKRGEEYYQLWRDKNHVFVKGRAIPKSYYTYIIPKDKSLIDMEYPSNDFMTISNESPYINKNFDNNLNEYYQPKKSKYDNKDFDKIFGITRESNGNIKSVGNKPLYDLYNALNKTMEDSNSKLDFLTRKDMYRVPQISGSMYQYIKADGILKGLLKYTTEGVAVTQDDPGYVDRPTTRPDGSPLRMIPTYYIKMLDNPNEVTNDLVGSVIAYHKMAENFKQKTEILPDVEIINYQLKNRSFKGKSDKYDKAGVDTNASQFLSKFLDMNLYGEHTKAMEFEMFDKKFSGSKIVNSVKQFGTLLGLGLNLTVASVGFLTAGITELGFAMNGRVFDLRSLAKAHWSVISNLYSILSSNANVVTNNKYVELLKMFEVGTDFQNTYKNSNRIPLIESFARNWAFGLFTVSDYIIKGTILNATMQNYKYFNGRFMSKEQFKLIIGNESDASEIWKTLESTYDVIQMKNGVLYIEDEAKRKAFEDVRQNIASSARTMGATADGQLTELQKTQIAANAFGGLIFMFRNYIPNLVQERVTMKKQFDYQTGMVREAEYRAIIRLSGLLLKDIKNKEGINEWYKRLDNTDKGNLRQFAYEFSLLVLLNGLVIPAIKASADDDKKNWLKNFAALLFTKSTGEFTNMYNPYDLYRTLKSVSSLPDILNPFTNIISLQTVKDLASGDKKIKYGVYKGKTRTERALWKMLPTKNIYELQDPAAKRKYYEQMYDK